ncbi:MAG: hypothetical protein LBU60_04410 [Clostridiales bacterium]|jgi:hypothetical protein|nr:hypothetical protein [Clostridiales bacterium]
MLKNTVTGFKGIVDRLAIMVASILVVLWLWVPALYSLLFFIIMILSGVKFDEYATLFWSGFFGSVALGIILLILRGPRQFRPTNTTSQNSDFTQLQSVPQSQNTNTNNQYFLMPNLENNPSVIKNESTLKQIETPLVFASRVDPNLFVHEYNDRLIFYKREGRKIFYLGTEFKYSDNFG